MLASLNGDAGSFTQAQFDVQVALFMDLHTTGALMAGIFWGLWLLPYAYLLRRSGVVPVVIPILLVLECGAWLVYSVAGLQFWTPVDVLAPLPAVASFAELLVPLWLLIKGIDLARWQRFERPAVSPAGSRVS